jgi:O-methyltransferase involved in polyketide biosynthesis
VIIQIANVGLAAQKPKQLVDDRFEMELLGRQKGKTLTQIESRLCSEDGQCAGSSSIAARSSFLKDEAKKIVILSHLQTVVKVGVGFQPMFR